MFTLMYGDLVEMEDDEDIEGVIIEFLDNNNFDANKLNTLEAITKLKIKLEKNSDVDASAKSSISSTVPAAILCMDENGYLTSPIEESNICRGDDKLGLWPNISEQGGEWSGCEMSVSRDENGKMIGFEYCALLPLGGIAQCRETGCVFAEKYSTSKAGSYADPLLTRYAM